MKRRRRRARRPRVRASATPRSPNPMIKETRGARRGLKPSPRGRRTGAAPATASSAAAWPLRASAAAENSAAPLSADVSIAAPRAPAPPARGGGGGDGAPRLGAVSADAASVVHAVVASVAADAAQAVRGEPTKGHHLPVAVYGNHDGWLCVVVARPGH